jgi:glyoxylase-like metal-dependent hydrolase (beta-lactamase superfamily II)
MWAVLRGLLWVGVLCGAYHPLAWAACAADAGGGPWQPLAPGVWVWAPAQVAEVSAANAGFVGPVTAIVDGGRALVIDPGPSLVHGRRVRQSVACQLRARVVAVVNTHAHAENVLGNAAFADVARVYASAPTAQAMADRCPQCLQSLIDRVGAAAMAGTHIVLPTRVLKAGDTLRLGPHRVQVWAVEAGHTEGDLVLWMPRTRTLWVGGLAYQGRVPELAQGRLDSWVLALDRLMALQARAVVSTVVSSGPMPGGANRALADTHTYLLALRERVWAAMDAGGTPHDAQALAVPWAMAWVGYEARHGFNAQRAWRELEPGWMAR